MWSHLQTSHFTKIYCSRYLQVRNITNFTFRLDYAELIWRTLQCLNRWRETFLRSSNPELGRSYQDLNHQGCSGRSREETSRSPEQWQRLTLVQAWKWNWILGFLCLTFCWKSSVVVRPALGPTGIRIPDRIWVHQPRACPAFEAVWWPRWWSRRLVSKFGEARRRRWMPMRLFANNNPSKNK